MMITSTEKIETNPMQCTAFEGFERIASGQLSHVALKVKQAMERGASNSILIFDDATSEVIELDFRGTADDVLKRIAKPSEAEDSAAEMPAFGQISRRPGRPKLGVVAREVTLLPRHWDWLSLQPGGASVALRKLVDGARHANAGKDGLRQAQEACYRFMSVMAGDLPGFEEATRAFFAGDRTRFDRLVEAWPVDVRDRARELSGIAFEERTA